MEPGVTEWKFLMPSNSSHSVEILIGFSYKVPGQPRRSRRGKWRVISLQARVGCSLRVSHALCCPCLQSAWQKEREREREDASSLLFHVHSDHNGY